MSLLRITFLSLLFHLIHLFLDLFAEREETDRRNVSGRADPCDLCTKIIPFRTRERRETVNLPRDIAT